MARQIEELAAFVATARWEDVPPSVQHHTKIVLLDTLGVILAGGERPEVCRLREQLSGGSGAIVYARGWPTQDPRTAALLNGMRGAPPSDKGAIAKIASRLAALMRATPDLLDVEINPLIVYSDGALALDALMITAETLAKTG